MPARRAPEQARQLVFAALCSVFMVGILIQLVGLHVHLWAIPLTFVPAGVLLLLAYWRSTR